MISSVLVGVSGYNSVVKPGRVASLHNASTGRLTSSPNAVLGFDIFEKNISENISENVMIIFLAVRFVFYHFFL